MDSNKDMCISFILAHFFFQPSNVSLALSAPMLVFGGDQPTRLGSLLEGCFLICDSGSGSPHLAVVAF